MKDNIEMDEISQMRYEIQRDAVDNIFRDKSLNKIEELEKIGFTYVEDKDREEDEGLLSTPRTEEQKLLINYFENKAHANEHFLTLFIKEKNRDVVNYALFRHYFKQGNPQLKSLLLYGLEKEPTNSDLLSDLGFMHRYSPMLKELINHYLLACGKEKDLDKVEELACDFHTNTIEDGYDAFYELSERFSKEDAKKFIINRAKQNMEGGITF